jgi:hypothetical protein
MPTNRISSLYAEAEVTVPGAISEAMSELLAKWRAVAEEESHPLLEQQRWEQTDFTCHHVTILHEVRTTDLEAEVTAPGAISEAVNQLLAKWREVVRAATLQEEIILLKERITSLEQQRPLLVPIETLAPEPYLLLHPISAVVRLEQDEYVATWYDAGLAASGANPEEAVANLKDIIVAVHESLQPLPEEKMGPVPLRQYRLLTKYIDKRR